MNTPLAFPQLRPDGVHVSGMTLRDWFAGQVIAGVLAADDNYLLPKDGARYAYEVADEMLAARGVQR